MKKQLLNLAIGECAALCTFIYIYRLLNLGMSSFLAFAYLIFILLQGSIYWFYRYILLIKRVSFSIKAIKLLRFLRQLNMIVLLVIGLIIPIFKSDFKDLFIAIGLFLFGVIEYVNYYWYRLSYGKLGFNIRILFKTKLQESSINKLINKQS
ncbi:hypothetical protein F8154_12525 [Alkaliphilus pronyensis]|uniref:Uncharacterized protein n=1 Tax=Alkaliphilus pronyensis TaxID=1482732 RepID=A0A6I0F5X9_9FIRM|nr:hypothetical protein [Alkaliphilus pronyensis]KAB3531768.1 hypothetical protein F8154_12525 [Alkaliphilus pronyensis]